MGPPVNIQMVTPKISQGMMPPHSGLFSLVHKRYSATIMASAMAKPAMNFKIIAPSISKSPL